MKRLLLILSITTTLSAYAICPLDPSGNGSCTENIIPSHSPIYENYGITETSPETSLQPLNKQDPLDQMRNPNNRLNDTLSCPFGICSQGILSPYGNLP